MSETLNDENAAGNDDVSERRAVEHRALEQCDVVHHGVVSGYRKEKNSQHDSRNS